MFCTLLWRNRDVVEYMLKKPEPGELINQEPAARELINQKDADGNTPLQLVHTDDMDMLTLLLSDMDVDIWSENYKGETIMESKAKVPNDDANAIFTLQPFYNLLCLAAALSKSEIATPYKKKLTEIGSASTRSIFNWRMERFSVMATLVATVTFAAGLAAPDGYINDLGPDQGTVTLRRKAAFKAFIFFDTVAMFISLFVVSLSSAHVQFVGKYALLFTMGISELLHLSLLSMALAFATGIYAVLEPYSRGMAVVVFLISFAYIAAVNAVLVQHVLQQSARGIKVLVARSPAFRYMMYD